MAKVARLRELYRKQTCELLGEDVLPHSLKPRKKNAAPPSMEIDTKLEFKVSMAPVSPVLPGRVSSPSNFDIGQTRRIFAKRPFDLLNGDSLILHSSKPRLVGQKRPRPDTSQRTSKKPRKSSQSMTKGEQASSLLSGPFERTPVALNVEAFSPKVTKFRTSKIPALPSKLDTAKTKNEPRAALSSTKKSRIEKSKEVVNPSPLRSAPVLRSQKAPDSSSNGSADSIRNSERKRGSDRTRDTRVASRRSRSPDEITKRGEKKTRKSKIDTKEDARSSKRSVDNLDKKINAKAEDTEVIVRESREKASRSDKISKDSRKVGDEEYVQDSRRKEKRSENPEKESRRKERETEKSSRKSHRRDDRADRKEARRREKSSDSVEKERRRRDSSPAKGREPRRRSSKADTENDRKENGFDTPEKSHRRRDPDESRSRTTTKELRGRESRADEADRSNRRGSSSARRRDSRSEAAEKDTRRKSTRAEEKGSRRRDNRSDDLDKDSRRLDSRSQGEEVETRQKLSKTEDMGKRSRRRDSRTDNLDHEPRRRDNRLDIDEKESKGRGGRAVDPDTDSRREGHGSSDIGGGSRSKDIRSQRPEKPASKRSNGIEVSSKNSSRKHEPDKVRATSANRTVNKSPASALRSSVPLSTPLRIPSSVPLSKPVPATASVPSSKINSAPSSTPVSLPRLISKPIAAIGSAAASAVGSTNLGPSATNGSGSANAGPSSDFRSDYVKLKEKADELWTQKKYDEFEQKVLQASEKCFEWAIARERDMRKNERHIRASEKSRDKRMIPIREHYLYLVRKMNEYVKNLESINRKRSVDSLKRIVNKSYLRMSLLASLWAREKSTQLQDMRSKLNNTRMQEIDDEEWRLLRHIVQEFSNQRELFNLVSSDSGFGPQEPGTECSLR